MNFSLNFSYIHDFSTHLSSQGCWDFEALRKSTSVDFQPHNRVLVCSLFPFFISLYVPFVVYLFWELYRTDPSSLSVYFCPLAFSWGGVIYAGELVRYIRPIPFPLEGENKRCLILYQFLARKSCTFLYRLICACEYIILLLMRGMSYHLSTAFWWIGTLSHNVCLCLVSRVHSER